MKRGLLTNRTITSQLFGLVMLAAVPVVLCFIVYLMLVYADERQRGLEQLGHITDSLARSHANQIEYAASTLGLLADGMPPVVDQDDCDGRFSRLVSDARYIVNAGLVAADGHLLCSAVGGAERPDLSAYRFVRQASEPGQLSIGEAVRPFAFDDEQRVIHLAKALEGADGVIGPLLFVAVDPSQAVVPEAVSRLGGESILTLVAEDGRILYRDRNPDRWIGHYLEGSRELLEQVRQGHIQLVRPGLDGVERNFSAYAVTLPAGNSVYAVAGVPLTMGQLQAQRYLLWFVILFLLALLSLTLLARLAGRSLVQRNIAPLLVQIDRLRRGQSVQVDGADARMSREFRDIMTHLRLAEQERRASLERLRLHVDESPLAVVEWDADFRVRAWAGRATALFGWTADEVMGKHPDDWGFVYEEDRPALGEHLDHIGERARKRFSHENRNWTRDGRIIRCAWFTSILRDDEGRFLSYISFALDVTDRVMAEERLRTLNRQLEWRVDVRTRALEQANRELESFSYSVSHDLRAPLRGIDGFAQALEEDYGDSLDETARGYLGRIQRAADRMGQLIDDLLRLSRVSRAELNRSSVSISRLAEEIASTLRERYPESEVIFDLEPGLEAEADGKLARMVLENLLDNAWKFSSRTPEPRISLRGIATRADEPGFELCDNGAGFDPHSVDKLFTPFQRLHSVDEFEGTGIGLATVHRIVTRHGGWVTAHSDGSGGACFRFSFGTRGSS